MILGKALSAALIGWIGNVRPTNAIGNNARNIFFSLVRPRFLYWFDGWRALVIADLGQIESPAVSGTDESSTVTSRRMRGSVAFYPRLLVYFVL